MSFTVSLDIEASDVGDAYEAWLAETTRRVASLDGFSSPRMLRQKPTDKPQVVFVLGGPGAGKGTQCSRIQETFGYQHISAGDCLRAERASGSKDAKLINDCIKDGKIVPVEITVKLLMKAMETSGKSKFLIDGFPRNLDNLEGWNRVVGSSADVKFVLFFDAPEKVMEQRLLRRGETSGRVDDNLESIRKRFHTYRESSMPIIHKFEAVGKVRHVNADNDVDAVFKDVTRIISTLDKTLAPSTRRYNVTFDVADRAAYDAYRAKEVPAIRDAALSKFGSNVAVTSRMFNKVPVASCSAFSPSSFLIGAAIGSVVAFAATKLLAK